MPFVFRADTVADGAPPALSLTRTRTLPLTLTLTRRAFKRLGIDTNALQDPNPYP